MATQYDPIAKDGSLNTTEATPRNIADVLAEELSGIASALTPAQLASLADVTISSPSDGQTLKYDAITQKWVNANDAGGHTIENPSGTGMTQRGNLQFVDAHLTDNALDNKTEVEIAKEVTEAAFDALNPLGTEYDGAYLMEVADATPLTADMVGYNGGTVKGALDGLTKPINVPWTKTIAASDGGSIDVTPTIPAGYTVVGASVFFSQRTHWVFYNMYQENGTYTIYLRNFLSSSVTMSGYVLFSIAKI